MPEQEIIIVEDSPENVEAIREGIEDRGLDLSKIAFCPNSQTAQGAFRAMVNDGKTPIVFLDDNLTTLWQDYEASEKSGASLAVQMLKEQPETTIYCISSGESMVSFIGKFYHLNEGKELSQEIVERLNRNNIGKRTGKIVSYIKKHLTDNAAQAKQPEPRHRDAPLAQLSP